MKSSEADAHVHSAGNLFKRTTKMCSNEFNLDFPTHLHCLHILVVKYPGQQLVYPFIITRESAKN